jgi:hypothetical protein
MHADVADVVAVCSRGRWLPTTLSWRGSAESRCGRLTAT